MYKILIDKRVLRALDRIPVAYLASIRETINMLASNPRPFGCVKLVGFEKLYRIRVGVYRIIYSIEDEVLIVEVLKIDHRSSVYK
jgi:mRNA interferase RelE/StbE